MTRLFLLFACALYFSASLYAANRVGQGVPISNATFPEAVFISVPGGFCSATFVSATPPTLLTASHCLGGVPLPSETNGNVSYQGVASHRICVKDGGTVLVGKNDIGIVVFKTGKFKVPGLTKLTFQKPNVGDKVVLVGFGGNNRKATPVKRYGRNQIHHIASESLYHHGGMIVLNSNHNPSDITEEELNQHADSFNAPGDSGGPLYLDTVQGHLQIGTVSGGEISDGGVVTGYYTNFHIPALATFLNSALAPEFLRSLEGDVVPSNYTDICSVR